ncbi:MAG: reverse transcriptase-like protein, partial [bacterium]
MHAEALAFQAAVPLALQCLQRIPAPVGVAPTVIFQMDNLPLVQHFNKEAKCSHLLAARIIARASLSLFCHVHKAVLEYIPRESNVFADYAAGLASAHLQSLANPEHKASHNADFDVNLPLPE